MKKILILITLIIIFIFNNFSSKASNDISFSLESVKEEYNLTDTLKLSNTINLDNNSYEVEYFLKTPLKATLYGYEFTLNEIGLYEITARINLSGEYISASKKFIVNQQFCDVSSESSNVSLNKKGLAISLSEGDTATINKTLDLSNVTKDDELLKIEIVPLIDSFADFTIITVSFIDVEDPNSYLKVMLQSSPDNKSAAYALAGATNQPLTGYEKELGRLHKNNQWGAFFPLSFYGATGANKVIDIRFDSETKEVYSIPNYRIIDLDDPDFFSNKWEGFTSGKVYVEVSASSYLKNSANLLVTSYGNKKIDSFYATDVKAPQLEIDVDLNNVPNGIVGKKYPLFTAKAIDDSDKNVEISKKVYRNYRKTNQYNISIDDDSFIPTEEGIYTIEYTAVDKFGNEKVSFVNLEAYNEFTPITLSIIKSNLVTEGLLGQKVKVADYYVSGGCGNVTVEVNVNYNGASVEILDGEFVPHYEGNYDIVYKASDYLGNQMSTVYNFTGVKTDIPHFENEPELPRYFINGKTYNLADLYGIDYSAGSPNEVKAIAYLEDSRSRKNISGKDFVISTTNSQVKIIYMINDFELEKEIEVIDVGEQDSLDLGKYFVGQNSTSLATENGISICGDSDAGVTFIRELLSADFSIKLNLSNASNIGSLSLVLTDSVNKDESVKLTLEKYADKAIFLINDKKLYELTESGFISESQSNEFTITSDGNYICPFGNVSLAINTYLNQQEFKGFTSNKIYLDILVEKVTGQYEYFIKNISGQPLNNTNKDRIKPLIVINGKYGGEYNINEVVELNPAMALDVLDPNIEFYLSVLHPNGSYVLDENGVELNNVSPLALYRFVAEDYGYYNVIYTAKDSNNKQDKTFSYSIICEDKIKPEVSFNVKEEAKANEKLVITDVLVTDNFSTEENLIIYAYLVMPDGQNILMNEGYYAFVPKYSGIYKVVIYAYDEAFNIGLKEVVIKVVE